MSKVMGQIPRRLLTSLFLASLIMAVGFWLKWRILSPLDPEDWYLQATSQFAYTDIIGIYLERDVASHPLPYTQMKLEYPPVVGVVMYLAGFANGPKGFLAANYAVLALAGLGTAYAIYLLRDNAQFWIYAATPPLVLYTGLNWDLLAIFFAMTSLALFQRRYDGWSAAVLALGVWAKLFPILLLPAMVLYRGRERNWHSLVAMGAGFGIVSLAVNLPFLLLNYSGWRYFFDFHALREPDGGSLWAQLSGLSPALANNLSLIAVAAGLAVICAAGLRNRRPVAEQGLGALALFLLFDKVSSPQYHLWLMPFLALFPPPLWLIGIFLTMDLAYYTSSFHLLFLSWGGQNVYADIIGAFGEPISRARQVVLLVLSLWAILRLFQPPRQDEPISAYPFRADKN